MIPKTILQTSKDEYPQYVKKMWEDRIDSSWKIDWYNDDSIIDFFNKNPLDGFGDIIKVFNSFTDGGHKADLFRYYYLYLNGGYFIDSDVMSHVNMNDIYSSDYDHVLVRSDIACNRICHSYIDSPIIFNGIIACIPRSKIIYEALVNAYNTSEETLKDKRLFFVHALYGISEKYKNEYKIKYYEEVLDYDRAKYCSTIDDGSLIMTHYFAQPKTIPHNLMINNTIDKLDDTLFFTTFNETGYKLYGKAWIQTFIANTEANKNIRAKIYCENFMPDITHPQIEFVDYNKEIPEQRRWKVFHLAASEHMKYTKDMTIRFSHKAFAIAHTLKTTNSGYAVWVDGDCIFKLSDFSKFASNITHGTLLACQVETLKDSPVCHIESGVLVFNAAHRDKTLFVDSYMDCYKFENIQKMPNDTVDTRELGSWKEYGPYDGFIAHKALTISNIDYVNLNENNPVDSPTADTNSTFLHPSLNSRFVHNIGEAGKIHYNELNTSLGIDDNTEWTHEKCVNMNRWELTPYNSETVLARYNNTEFPFVIHDPMCDRVVSSNVFLYGSWESQISDIIINSMKQNGVFVDIGANIGWHTKIVQNAGYDVIAFEPLSINYNVLKSNCTKEGSVLYNFGLGDSTYSANMSYDITNYGDAYIDNQGDSSIDVKRLDDVITHDIAQRIDVVKIDVQGYETKILQGAEQFLNSLRPGTTIILEVSEHRKDFDIRYFLKTIFPKMSSSYAICHWHDKPIPFVQARKEVVSNMNHLWKEYDLVLIK